MNPPDLASYPRIDWPIERDRIDFPAVAENLLGPAPGRRGGSGLWWRCPFHNDMNPSFHVDPVRLTWKCFGCGEHGDTTDLVMRVKGVGFREAIAELTGRASLSPRKSRPVPATRPAPGRKPSGLAETDAHALVVASERRLWSSRGGGRAGLPERPRARPERRDDQGRSTRLYTWRGRTEAIRSGNLSSQWDCDPVVRR